MPKPKTQKPTKPADPWSRMDAIIEAGKEPTGPEWFTAEEFHARYPGKHTSLGGAGNWLDWQTERGVLEKWSGVTSTNRRTTRKFRFRAAT